ncbi:DsbA family oxidoreductase [Garicola koreensis]|uniref:Putative DsbA family dithiol-disulfide isomerase n=1 Tax=Garicola koreensis TaxID=1262554 RepID=A0A7W5TTA0_9MICC|nr:DsbA family oxidoreductase [Garicola koreensis]MBB3667078.1 putative DsbA family dithiol-disulfide isomerase [Garicola koreensis]
MSPIRIDIWSDFVCPFCYMGEALLQQALQDYDDADQVTIRYHSYQLMPELPTDTAMNSTEMLVQHKGMAREQAEAANAQVTGRAASLGLDYRLEQSIAANTRTAHRLTHYAAEHGTQRTLVRRLFAAHFTEGLNLGDADTLADLAAEAGLNREAAYGVVVGDDYAAAVDADIAQAKQIGASGVPFFVFNQRLALSGAQPVEAFKDALRQAAEEPAERL